MAGDLRVEALPATAYGPDGTTEPAWPWALRIQTERYRRSIVVRREEFEGWRELVRGGAGASPDGTVAVVDQGAARVSTVRGSCVEFVQWDELRPLLASALREIEATMFGAAQG